MTEGNFELLHQRSAAAESRLQKHKKVITTCLNGELRGQVQSRYYRAMSGIALLAAREEITHGNADPDGGFLKWLSSEFPNLPARNAQRRMEFGRAISEKCDKLSFFSSQNLKLKKSLSASDEKEFLKILPEVMEGKSEVEFMRDMKLLKEPQEPTYHAPREMTAEEKLAADLAQAKESWLMTVQDMESRVEMLDRLGIPEAKQVTTATIKVMSHAIDLLDNPGRKEVLDALVEINNKLRESLKLEA
jgi:hypothetical protein